MGARALGLGLYPYFMLARARARASYRARVKAKASGQAPHGLEGLAEMPRVEAGTKPRHATTKLTPPSSYSDATATETSRRRGVPAQG